MGLPWLIGTTVVYLSQLELLTNWSDLRIIRDDEFISTHPLCTHFSVLMPLFINVHGLCGEWGKNGKLFQFRRFWKVKVYFQMWRFRSQCFLQMTFNFCYRRIFFYFWSESCYFQIVFTTAFHTKFLKCYFTIFS